MTETPPIAAERAPWRGYAFLMAGMAVVGSYVALAKPLTGVFPIFLLAWMRFGLSAIAMIGWARVQPGDQPIGATQQRQLFLQSLFGNFLFSICMLYGVSQTTASASGVILATIPAVVAVLSWAWLRERVGPRVWLAVAIALIGLTALALTREGSGKGAPQMSLIGNALIFAAVCCESVYVILSKQLTQGLSPKRISALINLWGLVLMTPLGLWQAQDFDFRAVSLASWGLLLFYSLAASMISTWLWMTGVKTVPANRSGVFTVAMPVTASLIGLLAFGETFSASIGFAFACAVVAIALITRGSA